jgi:aldose 1-epimerase
MDLRAMKHLALTLLIPFMTQAANYTAQKIVVDGLDVLRLTDAAHQTEVSIAPVFGNNAYEMKVNGKNIFWTPSSLKELVQKPTFAGNPFLAPWANRLDQDAFYANGKKYLINPNLENFRRDPNHLPIHGLLSYWTEWKVAALEADASSARATCRLEFWKYPGLMAQFPFAHTIEMTYRLRNGVLEVETVVQNHSVEPMPVSIGYHPYFRLHDAPRDTWKVHLAAKEQVVLSDRLVPTGERKPVTFSDPVSLAGTQLDDVFTGLKRGPDGLAEFWVEGQRERITVVYGPKYNVAVVYAPPGKDFICFEPMAALTNALNMAHAGLYRELQSIPAGGEWRESFWVKVSGF